MNKELRRKVDVIHAFAIFLADLILQRLSECDGLKCRTIPNGSIFGFRFSGSC